MTYPLFTKETPQRTLGDFGQTRQTLGLVFCDLLAIGNFIGLFVRNIITLEIVNIEGETCQNASNQAIAYLKLQALTEIKSEDSRWLPGFFGFIGFQAFIAFPNHNPWFLFLFCFFIIFSEFRHWKDELKYLGALGVIGLVAAPVGIIGIIKV